MDGGGHRHPRRFSHGDKSVGERRHKEAIQPMDIVGGRLALRVGGACKHQQQC